MSPVEIPAMACRSAMVPDSPKRSTPSGMCREPTAAPSQARAWLEASCTLTTGRWRSSGGISWCIRLGRRTTVAAAAAAR